MTHPTVVNAPDGLPFIEITREFDAPVEALYEAHRDPELYKRWIGPHHSAIEIPEWTFEPGGAWSFIDRSDDGTAHEFRGVFHTVHPGELVIQTFEYGGVPDVVSLNSLRFVRLDGDRCRLEILAVHPSVEARDGMISSGMEGGVVEGYRKLEDLLAAR